MFSSFHIFIRRRHPTKVDVWGRKSFSSISLSLLQLSHNTVLNHIIIHCLARELFLALISLHAATERGHGNGNFSSHMTTLRMGSHYEIMKKKTKEKFQFPWERGSEEADSSDGKNWMSRKGRQKWEIFFVESPKRWEMSQIVKHVAREGNFWKSIEAWVTSRSQNNLPFRFCCALICMHVTFA